MIKHQGQLCTLSLYRHIKKVTTPIYKVLKAILTLIYGHFDPQLIFYHVSLNYGLGINSDPQLFFLLLFLVLVFKTNNFFPFHIKLMYTK